MAFSFIDMKMVPSKLVYLVSEGYIGSIVPFLNIFYVSLGLTATEAGLITGISYIFSALISPLWGICADITGHRKIVFLVLSLGTTFTVSSMPWIAEGVRKTEMNITCTKIDKSINTTLSNESLCFTSMRLMNSNELFYTLLILTVAARAFFVTLPNYLDGYIMNAVKTNENGATYGAQRVFGSIGFGAANFITGVIVDAYKPAHLSHYTAVFYVFLPLSVLLLPAGYILVGQAKLNNDRDNEVKMKIWTHLKVYLKNIDNIIFLLTVMLSGVSLNIFLNFLFLLMDDDMNSSKTLMTATILTCMVTELLTYPFSSKFIHYMKGTRVVMVIGILSYFPRFLLMSYVTNPWLMLPIQILHPFGLPFPWTAHLEYTFKNTPNEIKMTLINTVSSIHFVFSSGIANIVGGVIYNNYGGRVLFRASAGLCLAWATFLACYYFIMKNKKKHRTKIASWSHNRNDVEV